MKEAAQFQPNLKALIVLGLVILIAIVIHHVVLVNQCCPKTDDTGPDMQGGSQPPYIAELRLLNGSGKRVKLETVKVNLDPMMKGSMDPNEACWHEIQDTFDPPFTEWLESMQVRHAGNESTPEKVFGVYVKAVFENGDPHERLVANLEGLRDTSVTVVAEIVQFQCEPPPEEEAEMKEEERIVLCVAEGISSYGLAKGVWDDD